MTEIGNACQKIAMRMYICTTKIGETFQNNVMLIIIREVNNRRKL